MAVVSSTPGLDQVACGGAPEVVRGQSFVCVPCLTRLFPESNFNTSRDPLAAEIRGVEHRAVVRAEKFFERAREFRRQRQRDGVAVLDGPGRQVYFALVKLDPWPDDLLHRPRAAA